MSLLVWLPLHGNLNNYGLSPAKFTMVNNSGGLTTATGGKTNNSCYRRATKETADYITSDISFTMDGDYSMCCWCKVTDFGTNNSANGIITHHGPTTGGGGITMRYISASDYRMSINTGVNNDERTYMTYYSTTNIYNTWHHLCMTYNRSERKYRMYIDGKQETIKTDSGNLGDSVTLNDGIHARPFRIFDWSVDHSHNGSYRPPCYLNDVRLYDHCLSNKEIEEIARGLVAHYPLAKPNNNLLTNTAYPTSTSNLIQACDIVYDSELQANVFQRSMTTGVESYIYSSRTPQVSKSTNYIFSCDMYLNDYANSTEFFWLSDTEANKASGVNYVTVTNKPISVPYRNKWFHVTVPFTTPSTDYTGYVRLDLNGSKDTSKTAILKVTNLKLEKGTADTDWIPSSSDPKYSALGFNSTTIKDLSGLGPNGTSSGTLSDGATGGVYNCSTGFSGSQIISITNRTSDSNAITFAAWIKPTSYPSSNMVVFADQNSKVAFGFYNTADAIMSCGDEGNTTRCIIGLKNKWLTDQWNHIAITKSGTTYTFYLNGVEWSAQGGTYSNTNYWTQNSTNLLSIGARYASEFQLHYNGSISDFRIYSTVLTASQIADLVHSAAAIDDQGIMHTNKLDENYKANIDATNTINSTKFNERALDMMARKNLSDGSQWARIFYHKNNAGTVLFSSVDEALETNSTYKFSQLKYLNNYRANDGKFEFMLTCKELAGEASLTSGYNRWKQSSNPCEEYVAGSDGSKNATGYEPISISWSTNYWGGLGLQNASINTKSACLLSGSTGHGNWFYAIGAYESWGGGIPGPNAAVEEIELWVRVDTLPRMQINNSGNIIANNFIER